MILVTGGTGQVGTALLALEPRCAAPGRSELDLAQPETLPPAVAALSPEAIINCAAYTAVDAAEDDEETATIVNGRAVGVLAELAAERGIPFVTFSTDYVFDGTATTPYVESSPPNPINAYGRSKLAGERAALGANPDALVIRSSWVFSATHRNFVTTVLERAAAGVIEVVDDQWGTPTSAGDLAAAALQAMGSGASGILHITNQGVTTWFEFARTACELAGIDSAQVRATTTASYPTPARRPRYSVLGTERADALGFAPLRPWQDALAATLALRSRRSN
jgi:dTDP-4-dehydrorhamnose reductase